VVCGGVVVSVGLVFGEDGASAEVVCGGVVVSAGLIFGAHGASVEVVSMEGLLSREDILAM